MRPSLLAAAVALACCGTAHATTGTVIELQTPNAQATKFSQNGEYLVAFLSGTGGVRWTSATGDEELVPGMVYSNGINNLGTVSGAISTDGGSANGGHDLPALSPIGASAPLALPLPAGTDNVDVYDVSDDGTAVGLAWNDSFTIAKAYYYSTADGVVDLPVDSPTTASRSNAISADGSVIGGWNDDFNTGFRRGVVWVDRVATYVQTPDGSAVGEADGVSGNGQFVVGSSYPTADGSSASWRLNVATGAVISIPSMPFAFGVSDDGKTVVGASGFFDNPPRALYIWTEAGGSQQLSDYLTERGIAIPADLSLPLSGSLSAVSGDGTKVAGWTFGMNSLVSFVVTGMDAPLDAIFSNGFDGPPPVQDPSFEATTASGGHNPYWDSADSNPNAGTDTVFNNSGIPTHSGVYAAWFGSWFSGDAETQTFSQSVTMPISGPRYLNYWRFAAVLPDAAGTLTVSIDGTVVETTDLSAIAADTDYEQQSIDVSSFADGAAHVVLFQYDYPGGDADGNIFIDDVTVDAVGATGPLGSGHRVTRTAAAKLRKHPR
ncbi:MAG: hypothetical protein ABI843_12100 [Dokdonella sp.]